MTKSLKAIIIVVFVLAALFVIFGTAFNLIFRYISYSFYTHAKQSDEVNENVRKLEIGKDKDLAGYASSTDYTKAKKTVIYFGGSGEIAYNAVMKYSDIFKDKTVICVDYPGSQESKGTMNLKSMQEAAVRLYDYVINLDYVDKNDISVVGYSYGTGIATYLASERDCSKLVLVGPYRDIFDLYNKIFPIFNSPFGWFITDNINTKEYAKSVDEKTLIITSDSDTTIKSAIPYSLAHYFRDASVIEFKGIEHADYWSDAKVVASVSDFIR